MSWHNKLLQSALFLALRGWHVFPLVPGEKRPAVRDWENRATTDPKRITRCWSAGAFNIGIACGPSGLVVIDLDRPKMGQDRPAQWDQPGIHDGADVLAVLAEQAGQPFPADTFGVHTGRGGLHLYYQHPPTGQPLRNTAGTIGWLIDSRAHGGYVVAPGSVVAGRVYAIASGHNTTSVELPRWLAERLEPQPLPAQQTVCVAPAGTQSRYIDAAIQRQLAHLTNAPKGTRNRALYLSAVALGQLAAGGALQEQEAIGLLTQAAHQAGLRPAETARTIASGMRAGARRPRVVNP